MKYQPKIVLAYFKELGLPEPELEYQFHPTRKFRFDFAWPINYDWVSGQGTKLYPKVYLEVDGAIWIKGAHNRGAQMKKDWEKRNCATILGWRGLWVEPKDLCTVSTVNMVKAALGI